jgi:hypothetical protein
MGTRFHILVAVWGTSFVDRWIEFGFGSLLGDQNLPALAQKGQCKLTFLCRAQDKERLLNSSVGRVAKNFAALGAIPIDDLITQVPGVTLTRAFARGMAANKDSAVFIFSNADFVFSDGVLKSVADIIDHGSKAVATATLRCNAEKTTMGLRKLVTTSEALTLSAADLISLAIRNLHPTVTASLVDQNLVHHGYPNQFFWRMGQSAVMGHFFLLFPLAIAPTVPIDEPKCYCDYSFFGQYTECAPVSILNQKNHCFILELQDEHHEIFMLKTGGVSVSKAARHLKGWTTKHHRKFSAEEFIFGVADDKLIRLTRRRANKFLARLFDQFSTQPSLPQENLAWQAATNAAKRERELYQTCGTPVENEGKFRQLTSSLRQTPLHHEWCDERIYRSAIKYVVQDSKRVLTITSAESAALRNLLPDDRIASLYQVQHFLETAPRFETPCDSAVCILVGNDCANWNDIVTRLDNVLLPGAPVALIFVQNDRQAPMEGLDHLLIRHSGSLLGQTTLTDIRCEFAGGRLRRFFYFLVRRLNGFGFAGRFLAAAIVPVIVCINILAWIVPGQSALTSVSILARMAQADEHNWK